MEYLRGLRRRRRLRGMSCLSSRSRWGGSKMYCERWLHGSRCGEKDEGREVVLEMKNLRMRSKACRRSCERTMKRACSLQSSPCTPLPSRATSQYIPLLCIGKDERRPARRSLRELKPLILPIKLEQPNPPKPHQKDLYALPTLFESPWSDTPSPTRPISFQS